MAEGFENIGWPLTDEGPIVDDAGSKRARLRMLLSTQVGDHPVRPLYGLPLNDAMFEAVELAMKISIRQAVRDAVKRYEPGIILPQGDDGVNVEEREDGTYVIVRYVDIDEPEVYQDPMELRLRSA